MKDTVRYLSGIKDEPLKTSRFKFFISLRQNIKKNVPLPSLTQFSYSPAVCPPPFAWILFHTKGPSGKRQASLNLATQQGLWCHSKRERLCPSWLGPIILLSLPCPPAVEFPADDPEPFLMFGLTCRWLVCVCDSGDRWGCSFLNTMSESRDVLCALCCSRIVLAYFLMRKIYISRVFYVSHCMDKSATRHTGPKWSADKCRCFKFNWHLNALEIKWEESSRPWSPEVMKGHRDHSRRIISLWHTGSSLVNALVTLCSLMTQPWWGQCV